MKYKYYLNGKEYIREVRDSTALRDAYWEKEEVDNTFIIFVNPEDADKVWYDIEQFFRK